MKRNMNLKATAGILLAQATMLGAIAAPTVTALADEGDAKQFTVATVRWTDAWPNDFLKEGVMAEMEEKAGVDLDWQIYYNSARAKYPKGSAAYRRTLVGEGASIGANATIVCGHEIGSWALIGAGAVVVADVPAHALMLGVPAKCKGWVCECGQVLDQDLACGECGREYCATDNGLKEVKD